MAEPAKPQWIVKRPGAATAGGGKLIRTLLVKDTAVGVDIADHVTAYAAGTAVRIVGVLRKAIAANLTVRVKRNGNTLIDATIPSTTAIDTPVELTSFVAGQEAINDGDVFSWEITASDSSKDKNGVAVFTLEWG